MKLRLYSKQFAQSVRYALSEFRCQPSALFQRVNRMNSNYGLGLGENIANLTMPSVFWLWGRSNQKDVRYPVGGKTPLSCQVRTLQDAMERIHSTNLLPFIEWVKRNQTIGGGSAWQQLLFEQQVKKGLLTGLGPICRGTCWKEIISPTPVLNLEMNALHSLFEFKWRNVYFIHSIKQSPKKNIVAISLIYGARSGSLCKKKETF